MQANFLERVSATIKKHRLFPAAKSSPQGEVVVALSGGADSVALLRSLLALDYRVAAAHCNFQLRGGESDRDEAFVKALCKRLGVTLHTRSFDTVAYAREHGLSIEMAARELRYGFFREIGGTVAVAHHRDDNVETILLNMVRGTGLKGLTGMPYRNGSVVRPLLDVSRRDILDYLGELGQDFVTDSSNMVADVKRNVVRLRLMPLLRELNPSVEDTLLGNADRLRDVQHYVEQQAQHIVREEDGNGIITIRKDRVGAQVLLFEALRPLNFAPVQIEEIWQTLDGQPGAIWRSATHELLRDRDALIVKSLQDSDGPDAPLAPDNLGGGLSWRIASIEELGSVSRDPMTAWLDADSVGGSLEVRRVRQGDSFVPFGMKGRKLISRYMIDHKFTAFQKEQQLVVTNGTDIVWLVGERPSEKYKIVEGKTKRVLILTASKHNK